MNGFKIDIDETPDNYVYQFNQKKKKNNHSNYKRY